MRKILNICFAILVCFSIELFAQIPTNILVQISKAEDELRFDKTLENLMKSTDAKIRKRATLSAGRIGDERAVAVLTNLLEKDLSTEVRATAAFALGEIESVKGADTILKVLQDVENQGEIRTRAIEAAGKIAAANAKDQKAKNLGEAILDNLQFEDRRGKEQNRQVILLGITAVLRARPEEGDFVTAKFLTNTDARIRADAANTLSRLRSKIAVAQLRAMLLSENDAIARANAARALGAAEDKESFKLLLEAAVSDKDSRVRVSAIRSIGNLKDKQAADKLLERGEKLLGDYKKSKFANPIEKSELLEIATTLGNILKGSDNQRAINFLESFRRAEKFLSPEIASSYAKISPKKFLLIAFILFPDWREESNKFQGLTEYANTKEDKENTLSLEVLSPLFKTTLSFDWNKKSFPTILQTFAQFKVNNLEGILRTALSNEDIFVRATAAELLGEQPTSKENVESLKAAFAKSLETDKDYNDAQLAILSALVKLDKNEAVSSLRLALDAPDSLVRRHAANLIRQNELNKDFPNFATQIGTVKPYNPNTKTKLGQILNTNADYIRAVSRKNAKAILTTEKGSFTIEFFPEDAPLTVDNFIKLAKSGYFNGVAIHRVVPNFVMQDGDPRGDGNGGPGWQIRDEMNTVPYERGAVGMALSGKDTGGSQWFITHSPQPHLDGGYTVFGRVSEADMKIVDNLVRGDKILKVQIVENISPRRSK